MIFWKVPKWIFWKLYCSYFFKMSNWNFLDWTKQFPTPPPFGKFTTNWPFWKVDSSLFKDFWFTVNVVLTVVNVIVSLHHILLHSSKKSQFILKTWRSCSGVQPIEHLNAQTPALRLRCRLQNGQKKTPCKFNRIFYEFQIGIKTTFGKSEECF